MGVAQGAGRPRRGPAPPRAPTCPASSPSWSGAPPSSTRPPVEGVTLASLHAAKGLEWDAVFLVGVTDGMLPIVYAETPEQIEEERRLLYVGVTRAREHLSLSWALARSPGGRRSRRPSRFLDGLTGRPARPPGRRRVGSGARFRSVTGAPAVAVTGHCRVCAKTAGARPREQKLGRCAACPADYDEALLEASRPGAPPSPRRPRSRRTSVFTDVTLQAIAERAPVTEQDLLAIAGIGRVKLDRYGEAVLELCRAAANQTEDA